MRKINFRVIFFCTISFIFALVFARHLFELSIPYFVFLGISIISLFGACFKFKCLKRFVLLICTFIFGIGYYSLGFFTFCGETYNNTVIVEARVQSITKYSTYTSCILDNVKVNNESKPFNISAVVNVEDEILQSNIILFETKLNKVQLFDDDGFNSFYYKNDTPYKTTINNLIKIKNGYKKLNEKIHDLFNNFVDSNFNDNVGGIVKSVVIGDKSTLNKDIKNSFSSSGIAHLLAISGLHISIIVMILNFILKKCKIKQKYCFVIIAIILAFYCYVCNFSPSVVRASLMSLVFILSNVFGRKYDKLTSLSLCALLILLFKPLYIFDAGFLLSFGCVFCIFVIAPIISQLLYKTKLSNKLCDNFAMLLSVQLGLIPLIAMFYNSVNILSIVCNLICVPLFEIAFILTFAMLIICITLPFMNFLLKLIEFLYWLITNISIIFSSANFAFLNLRSTNALFVIGFYSLCFCASKFVNLEPKNKMILCSIVITCSVICSLFA